MGNKLINYIMKLDNDIIKNVIKTENLDEKGYITVTDNSIETYIASFPNISLTSIENKCEKPINDNLIETCLFFSLNNLIPLSNEMENEIELQFIFNDKSIQDKFMDTISDIKNLNFESKNKLLDTTVKNLRDIFLDKGKDIVFKFMLLDLNSPINLKDKEDEEIKFIGELYIDFMEEKLKSLKNMKDKI